MHTQQFFLEKKCSSKLGHPTIYGLKEIEGGIPHFGQWKKFSRPPTLRVKIQNFSYNINKNKKELTVSSKTMKGHKDIATCKFHIRHNGIAVSLSVWIEHLDIREKNAEEL